MQEFVHQSAIVATGVCGGLMMFGMLVYIFYKLFLASSTEEVSKKDKQDAQKNSDEKLHDIEEMDELEEIEAI